MAKKILETIKSDFENQINDRKNKVFICHGKDLLFVVLYEQFSIYRDVLQQILHFLRTLHAKKAAGIL